MFSAICCAYSNGAVVQLGERLLCTQEVVGSTPTGSITKGGQEFPPKADPPKLIIMWWATLLGSTKKEES